MIVKKAKHPTHRVYAVRKTRQGTSSWAEIGAAWTHDGGFDLKLNLLPFWRYRHHHARNLDPCGAATLLLTEIDPDDETVTWGPCVRGMS
jgi:hypothetical protein